MVAVSLAIIARNCPESLAKLLESVKPLELDEIVVVDTGSSDSKTKDVALSMGAKVFDWVDPRPDFVKKHGHISDFAKARAFSFEQCRNDMVLWLDADDVTVNPLDLKLQIEEGFKKHGENLGLAMSYFYSKDNRGNWNTTQKKVRLVNRKSFHWVGRVHEDLVANRAVKFEVVLPAISRIEHDIHAKDGAGKSRDQRNVNILEDQLREEGSLDPRLMKHLGQGYEGLGRYEEAIKAYTASYKASNWPEDIYHIKMNIAGCYRCLNLPHKAKEFDLEATEICPEFPNAWVNLAIDQFMMKQYHKALFYTQTALECKKISDTLGLNPAGLRLALYMVRYEAYRELGQTEKALESLKEVEKEHPNPEQWKKCVEFMEKCLIDGKVYRSFMDVAQSLSKEGNMEKMEMFYRSHPKAIADYPDFQWIKRKKPDVLKASVAIICPGEGWGPSSIEKGIGGSEEAVILLSKELVKQGLWVDVFTNTPEEGEHDGVNWYSFHAIRPSLDFYDTVVIWRQPELLDYAWNCQKLVFWTHDVQFPERWTEERIKKVDQVFFLSKYHRETAPFIPQEKVVITANGLDPKYFSQDVKRDSKKVIYVSNPTRGLREALLMWPEVHKRTGAILHTYYGWTKITQLAFTEQPLEAQKMHEIQELMRITPGVVDHGMVGMSELSKETASAGVAFYPTVFPEVSCISMMRNQALGAVPVTTNVAALKETVQHGVMVDATKPDWMNEIKEKLIFLIQNPEHQEAMRAPMMEWAQKNFLWESVAKQWFEILEGKQWTASVVTPKVELALEEA